jgi:hypothetical protein
MIVRCLRIVDATGRELSETPALRVGGEYVVLMISANPGEDVRFRVHEDVSPTEQSPHYPVMWPSSMFEVVRGDIPSNWRSALGGTGSPGYLRLAPGSWLRPGFWEDIWDWSPGSAEASEDYSRELAIILSESVNH